MKKILVIEDEEPVRSNLLELLEAENFHAIAADNGLSGMKLAQEHQPDLIICDVVMPGLDGYGTLVALRQNQVTALIPFIFITAKTEKADLRQGMELGADDYITKPFTRAEVLSAIATQLAKQAAIAQRYAPALRHAAERLNQLVHYDSLTNLPNQILLRERLRQILSQLISDDQPVALLSLSLDRLGQINDTLGYVSGDLLLKNVAKRLTDCVGAGDVVARLTANQFAIILTEISSRADAAYVAQAILDTLSRPFLLNVREVFITTSIGISLYPDNSKDLDTLLKQADIAMYQAKQRTGNHYQFYIANITVATYDKIALETSLRYALQRTEFQICYQPQINLKTQQIEAAEALVRWNHPNRGTVSPSEFIPLAEETGLITPLSEWILTTACLQLKAWHVAGYSLLKVAVNLSGYQFTQPNLSQNIAQILSKTGVNPQDLELELTETTLMQNAKVAIKTLSELRNLGIRIAIDDFGTGYSSLSYLKQFPLDTLKIGDCFIHDISQDPKNAAITTAIIHMAHNLGLRVIAEGVEQEAELAFLHQHQCDAVQGYLFAPPLPPELFIQQVVSSQLPHA